MLFLTFISVVTCKFSMQTIYIGDEFDDLFCRSIKSNFLSEIDKWCEHNSNCLHNISLFHEPICGKYANINDALKIVEPSVSLLTIFKSPTYDPSPFIEFQHLLHKIDVILYDNVLSSTQTSKQFIQQLEKIEKKIIEETQSNQNLNSETIFKLYIKYLPPQSAPNSVECGINGNLKRYVHNLYLLNGQFQFTDPVKADGIEFFKSQFDSALLKTSIFANDITFDVDSYNSFLYYSSSRSNLLSSIFSLRIHTNFRSKTIRIDYTSSFKISLSYSHLSFPGTLNYTNLVSILSYPNVKQFSIRSNCQQYSLYIDEREPIHYNFKNTNITVIPIKSLNNQIVLKSESAMNTGWNSDISPKIFVNTANTSNIDVSKLSNKFLLDDDDIFDDSRETISDPSRGYIFAIILFIVAMGALIGINIHILLINIQVQFSFDAIKCYFGAHPLEIFHYDPDEPMMNQEKEKEDDKSVSD